MGFITSPVFSHSHIFKKGCWKVNYHVTLKPIICQLLDINHLTH